MIASSLTSSGSLEWMNCHPSLLGNDFVCASEHNTAEMRFFYALAVDCISLRSGSFLVVCNAKC